MTDDPADLARILTQCRRIAVVGWSPKPDRPSHEVAAFLVQRGHQVIAVNPGQAGQTAPWGTPVVASLADIAGGVDMVDIFRRSEEVGPVVTDALAMDPRPQVIWMQLGVVNHDAADQARAAGLTVVMNRCPKIDIRVLGLPPLA